MDAWDFDQHLDNIDYHPQENSFLDIWLHEGQEPKIEEGKVDSGSLDGHLNKVNGGSRTLKIALRLLYSYDADESGRSDNTVYWSRSDFVKIIEAFWLPKRLAQMISRGASSFSVSSPTNLQGVPERFGYIFSTMFHHKPFWLQAASYDPETRTTYAFLHCTADPDEKCINRITKYIKQTATLAFEPLLLPVMIVDLETNLTMRDDQQYTRMIAEVEAQTRDFKHPDVLNSPKWEEHFAQLNDAAIFLSLLEREGDGVVGQLCDINNQLRSTGNRDKPPQQLVQQVEFLLSSRKNLALRIRNLQKRFEIQLNEVSRLQLAWQMERT